MEQCRVFFGPESCSLTLPDSAREALLSGHWDPIGELLEGTREIEETAGRLDYFHA